MKILSRTAAILAVALLATPVFAQPPAGAAPAAHAADTAAPQSGYRAEFLHLLDDVQGKIMSLAKAVPAEKYAWRPGPGVRSVGEVYMHIAGANYFFPTLWGGKIPAGVDPQSFEKEGGDKAKVVSTLEASFVHLRHAIESTPDADLDKPIQLFGHPSTVRAAMSIAGNHLHEHLGQSIAYARTNGVVPPWSAKEGAGGR